LRHSERGEEFRLSPDERGQKDDASFVGMARDGG
jgi:hypothetical protein